MGNKVKKVLSQLYSIWIILLWSSKILFCVCFKAFFSFSNGHFHNVVSTLPNVTKIDVENDIVVSKLSNVVQINVEIDNVDSTLLNVINANVHIHNVVSTLIWCYSTLLRHIKQRWNVCWVEKAFVLEAVWLVWT